jgi:predicted nucleotidyltransferase component of viral defense system
LIPRAHVTAWRRRAPWPTDAQVEQDLVLSRALVELFRSPAVADAVAFRGGSALHKLFLDTPGRYSEDIDLVQVGAGAIGAILDDIRATLDPWLGGPRRERSDIAATLLYRFDTTSQPVQKLRLKVEINTREHFAALGYLRREFVVDSPWFSGSAAVRTYQLEELLGTKLRALYQRKKGRDLYDLWTALTGLGPDVDRLVECFHRYLAMAGASISRAEFEANLGAKLRARAFLDDTAPLLATGVVYDAAAAGAFVHERIVSRLRGEPWKGMGA